MPASTFSRRRTLLPLLLAMIFAALAYIQYVTPYYGDDLTYLTFGGGQNWRGAIVQHWEWLNGRLPNLLLALSVRYLPHALVSMLAAASVVAWMWVVVCMSLCTRRPSASSAVVMIAVILVAFPWWDDFLMLAIEYNYVLSSLLGLLFLRLFLGPVSDRCHIAGGMILSAAAGAMHEAQSAAILFGITLYVLAGQPGILSPRCCAGALGRRLLLGSFGLGALVAVSSPAVSRAVFCGSGVADGPWWLLVVCSCPVAVALALIVAMLYIYNVCRRRAFGRTHLGELMRTDWSVYFFAAMLSVVVVAFAGVIGRSGWFGNTFALIALVRLVRPQLQGARIGEGIRRLAAAVFGILILAHLAALAAVQTRLGRQTEEVIAEYRRSSDGLVYHDGVLDRPREWYLLGRAVTMPLPGQFFKTKTFSRYYGSTDRPVLVMPVALAPGATVEAPRGWALLPGLPPGASRQIYPHYSRTRVMVDPCGQLTAIDSASARGYLLSPWPYDLTINNIAYEALRGD